MTPMDLEVAFTTFVLVRGGIALVGDAAWFYRKCLTWRRWRTLA